MLNVLLIPIVVVCMASTCLAQSEMGGTSTPSTSWLMLSYQRTWSPQHNNGPNSGFGFQAFQSIDDDRRWWLGGAIMGADLQRRDLLNILVGPGVYIVGTGRLGMFAFLQMGLSMSSASGLTSFDFFSDRTLSFGMATMSGVGASAEVFKFLRVQTAIVGNWYTLEGGQTPFGIQVGISTGGR